MPTWDADYCVEMFKREAGLPSGEVAAFTDDDIADQLSKAQVEVVTMIAARYPQCLYAPPKALIASQDRTTFSFGTDDQENPIVPMGSVQISPNIRSFDNPDRFTGWVEGRDFLDEGHRIRLPNGRNYSGTLYGRFIPTPPDISVTENEEQDPVLQPADARTLIVLKAVELWAAEGVTRMDLATTKGGQFKEKFRTYMTMYRTRYKGGGGLYDPNRWWFGNADLGTTNAG